ncbi:MAG: biotin--[acetyl-CoA-carboxylase] ligase [Lachnospiraceae bacterium]|nr:biotin--[acetyl-CoA-carboxylase] ligase [Lachnospiraceae bacterium]
MKTDRSDILASLRNAGDYVSGQQLCERLGVSRTAVWKVIKQLKEEGYHIESVSNKGYLLVESPEDVLSEEEIASRLTTQWAGRKLYCRRETGSTNNDAKRCGEEGDPHGTVVVADMQNAGKGRRGRAWQTTPGTALSFSILLRPDFPAQRASMITLVMALAVAQAVEAALDGNTEDSAGQAAFAEEGIESRAEKASDPTVRIKWPNDIVVNRKKVCGMLTEMTMTPEMNEIQYLVVGVGINVNNESPLEFQEEIRDKATSLRIEKGCRLNRAALLQDVLCRFERHYQTFLETLTVSGLREAYQARLQGLDGEVRVLDPAGEYTGISCGINDRGELLVERENGERVAVYAGEVSVRGLYGYV